MSGSTYLDNLMRTGSAAHNARITLSGTSVTVSEYGAGGAYTPANPLLLRVTSTSEVVVTSGTLTHDFGTATWGAVDDDGAWSILVGLQKMSSSSAQVCFCPSSEPGPVTTVQNTDALSPYQVAAPVVHTDRIVWIATIHNVLRQGGVWDTSNAFVEEEK
jgi:hypothetical protein